MSIPTPHVICLGEALIDFVADIAGVSLEECPGFRKAPGGAPANVAVGLARLGVPASFVGKVGDDPFGRWWWGDQLAELHVPGFAVDAVDTTGAGDGFVAALLAGVLEEAALEQIPPERMRAILTLANAVGALTCT